MTRAIRITAGTVSQDAELSDRATATAIWDSLPISATGNTWGDEIYFRIPVEAEGNSLNEVVNLGDLAFWPPGNAFCIFFGPTPASRGDEIRAASGVEVVGRITGDPRAFSQVSAGSTVIIERA